jgi:hypothetical protein
MRRFLLGLVLVASALAARADDAGRRYAVLSLLSDQITIVGHDMGTGSSLDQNRRTAIAMPGNLLDKRMVLAIDTALRRAKVTPEPVLLFTTDAGIFAHQARLLDSDAGPAGLLQVLGPVLSSAHATHLVLASKYRHDAALQMHEGKVGSGKLEGLGFYVDRSMRTHVIETGESAVGFLSAFTYFRLSLIDLASGKVLKDVPVYASTTRSAARGASGDAWDAMTPEDKVAALDYLLRRETARVVPMLLEP